MKSECRQNLVRVRLIRLDLQWKGRLHSFMWMGWDGKGWSSLAHRYAVFHFAYTHC